MSINLYETASTFILQNGIFFAYTIFAIKCTVRYFFILAFFAIVLQPLSHTITWRANALDIVCELATNGSVKKILNSQIPFYSITFIRSSFTSCHTSHVTRHMSHVTLYAFLDPPYQAVIDGETRVVAGDSVNLTCVSDALPAAYFTWTKRDQQLLKVCTLSTPCKSMSGLWWGKY